MEGMKLLLNSEADIDAQNREGRTSLMLACSLGDYVSATYLLDMEADTTLEDNQGLTAGDWAKKSKSKG